MEMKINESKSEDDFIKTGENHFSTQYGKLIHLCTQIENTTMNPKYKANCGKILKTIVALGGDSYCKKCYGK